MTGKRKLVVGFAALVVFALLGVAALVGVVVYWVALDSAVKTALQRGESILDELGRGAGPLSTS